MKHVIVFRTRLRDGVAETYGKHADAIHELALTQPGFRSIKDFTAADGERVAVIEWGEELEAWRDLPPHRAAQALGRSDYYAAYSLQVCSELRESRFEHGVHTSSAALSIAAPSTKPIAALSIAAPSTEPIAEALSIAAPSTKPIAAALSIAAPSTEPIAAPSTKPIAAALSIAAPSTKPIAAAWLAAFEARDLDALLALYSDDATHTSPKIRERHPDTGGELRGKAAMRAWWQDSFDRLPSLRYIATNIAAGSETVVLEYIRRLDGVPDMPIAEAFDVRDGRIIRSRVFHG